MTTQPHHPLLTVDNQYEVMLKDDKYVVNNTDNDVSMTCGSIETLKTLLLLYCQSDSIVILRLRNSSKLTFERKNPRPSVENEAELQEWKSRRRQLCGKVLKVRVCDENIPEMIDVFLRLQKDITVE